MSDDRIARIRKKYHGLQGNMLPFGDVIVLLAELDARDAGIATLREQLDDARSALFQATLPTTPAPKESKGE